MGVNHVDTNALIPLQDLEKNDNESKSSLAGRIIRLRPLAFGFGISLATIGMVVGSIMASLSDDPTTKETGGVIYVTGLASGATVITCMCINFLYDCE